MIEAATTPESQAVAVVCTNVFGAPLAASLEEELGRPVFDSVAVLLWKALDMVAPHVSIPGLGAVLESGSLRSRVQAILEDLLAVAAASRTTLRLDLSEHGLDVDLVAGEAVAPGVRSIRWTDHRTSGG